MITITKLAGLLGLLSAAWLAAGSGPSGEGREYPFKPGGALVIKFNSGGSARVTGGSRSGATVRVSASGAADASQAIKVQAENGGLAITSGSKSGGDEWKNLQVFVELPESCEVQFNSMGGALTLVGVAGSFSGKTMGGPFTLEKVRGRAHLETMGGDIEVTDSELDGEVSTMGGEVTLSNVVGGVEASSNGGNVRYQNVRDRDGRLRAQGSLGTPEMTGKTVLLSTLGGDIDVASAPEGASLKTMGGHIEVGDASKFIDATTMGGDIRLTMEDGWVRATTNGGDIDLTVRKGLGDGSKGIDLQSLSGNVTVTVPAGLSMNLDLTIAYTRNSDQNYKFVTDLGLKEELSKDWITDEGTPRKKIHATGSVGGGRYPVTISTINGDITIKRVG